MRGVHLGNSFYNYERDPFYYSWGFIFLAFCFFFPLGIFLVARRFSLHRRYRFTSGRGAIILGIVLIFFGIMIYNNPIDPYVLDQARELQFQQTYGSILGLGGLLVMFMGIIMRMKAKRYQKYIHLIVNEDISDIDVIAKRMYTTNSVVINDINKLIDERYLSGYVIDSETNRIITPKEKEQRKQEEHLIRMEEMRERLEKKRYTRVVMCPNCGASNVVEAKIGKCEYCNSYIQ